VILSVTLRSTARGVSVRAPSIRNGEAPDGTRATTLPRHVEIGPGLVREICKQLDMPLLADGVAMRVAELRAGGLTHEQVAARLNAEQVPAPTGGAWSRQSAWRTTRRGDRLLARAGQRRERVV
jgi:hypothetical protein